MTLLDILQQLQGMAPQTQQQQQPQPDQQNPAPASTPAQTAMTPPVGVGGPPPTDSTQLQLAQNTPAPAQPPQIDPMAKVIDQMSQSLTESQKRSSWAENLLRGWIEDSSKPYQDPNLPKGVAGRALYNVMTGFFGGIPGIHRRMLEEQQARQWQQTRIQEAQQYIQNTHAQQGAMAQMMNSLALQARIASMERRNDIIEQHNTALDPARAQHLGTQSARDLAQASLSQFHQQNPLVGGGMINMAQTQATGSPVWTVAPPLSRQPVGPQMMAASVDKVMRQAAAQDPTIQYNPQNPPKSLLDLPTPQLRQQAILDYNQNFHYELPDVAAQRSLNNAKLMMTLNDMKAGRANMTQLVETAAQNPQSINEASFQNALKEMKISGQFALAFNQLTGFTLPRKINQSVIPEGYAATSLFHINRSRALLQDPQIAASIGPIAGRLENLGQKIGTDLFHNDPALATKAQQLRTSLQYVFFREGKSVMGGRLNQQLMEDLKHVSAQNTMDLPLLTGALNGAEDASKAVLQEANDYQFGLGGHQASVAPIRFGPGSSAPLPAAGVATHPGRGTQAPSGPPFAPPSGQPVRKTFYQGSKAVDFELRNGQWVPVTQ